MAGNVTDPIGLAKLASTATILRDGKYWVGKILVVLVDYLACSGNAAMLVLQSRTCRLVSV